jgi:hypothetical protein
VRTVVIVTARPPPKRRKRVPAAEATAAEVRIVTARKPSRIFGAGQRIKWLAARSGDA